ncbi:c-type cytochrome [Thioclava sp. GXIMD4216]|uniref:c-type cytochrome n=1 Tax=Thioclava sp. GXIMD4216 TaxID=3131929 RepID=UPI0030D173AC
MLKFLRLIMWLAIAAIIVIAAMILVPQHRSSAKDLSFDAQWLPAHQDKTGEYVARVADCAACHTAEGGTPYAGGRAIASPFGTIYASNITPDKATGIGDWTLDEFRAALVDGIGKHGENLYPAMPYDNYRKLSEADIEALYTYFHDTLEPVENKVQATALSFPFNQRWGIRAWKWVGLPKVGFVPPSQDARIARGAYLVEGPGHCAACHSPRNLAFAQNGTDASDPDFLSGGVIDGWTAPDLRSADATIKSWSAADLDLFLASGRNAHAGVSGEMALAIRDSLQYLSDEDRAAMVAYLRSIAAYQPVAVTGEAAPKAAVARPAELKAGLDDATRKLLLTPENQPLGARLFMDNCAACHFADGKGAAGIFPALAGNATVTAKQSNGLVDTILHGAAIPSTAQRPAELKMPGFADRLSDDDVAALASFLRSAWGNSADPVSAKDVSALR